MRFDLLWTDYCFLIVVFLAMICIGMSMRKMHVRMAFARLFNRPIAVSTSIILCFFLVIAVMDSIHLKTANDYQSSSLLDKLMAPLGSDYEKTYSAPMALTLYSTETVLSNGDAHQVHPRLHYPPLELKNKSMVWRVTQYIVLMSVGMSLFITFMGFSVVYFIKIKMLQNKRCHMSAVLASALVTLFCCSFVIIASFWLSRYFHVLGTGKIGQDIYYYAVKSIRTGLVIGLLTTLFMLPLALFLGITAGYFGGVIDDGIQYIYTTLSSIPGVLLITASVLSIQTYIANHPEQFQTLAQTADARLLALCFILGVTSWTSLCRLLRAESLKLREVDFVLAAEALGCRSFRILTKHLLPNVMHIVLITIVLDFSFLVLAEAVLSYVGVGVSPLTMSWGNMINSARLELARDPIVWWPIFAAFLFMFTLVLASNLFADAVRDAFDPKQSSF